MKNLFALLFLIPALAFAGASIGTPTGLPPTGAASGALAGTFPAPTISVPLQVNGPASGSTFNTTPVSYVLRTDVPVGLAAGQEVDYNGTFTNATVGFAIIGALKDAGTGSAGSAHVGGILGYAQNGASSQIPILNELRTDDLGLSSTDVGAPCYIIANKVGATLTGRTSLGEFILMESYSDAIGGTPIAQGTDIGIQMATPTGGDPNSTYFLLGGLECQILTGGPITATAVADGTKRTSISNDGTNGAVGTNSGKLNLNGAAGNYEQAGTSAVYARVPALLSEQTSTTGIGNVSTGATTLMTYSLTGSTLVNNGDSVRIQCDIEYANNTNSKTVTLKIGSSTIYNLGAAIQNGWLHINATVTRTSATQELVSSNVFLQTTTTTTSGTTTSLGTETLANPLAITVTGTGGASNDLLQFRQEVEYWPAP
jgi:hypothetical protein